MRCECDNACMYAVTACACAAMACAHMHTCMCCGIHCIIDHAVSFADAGFMTRASAHLLRVIYAIVSRPLDFKFVVLIP